MFWNRHHGPTRHRTLTVLAALPHDARPALLARLAAVRAGAGPFADVPGTHFARLGVLGPDEFRRQDKAIGMRPAARVLDLVMHFGRRQKADPPLVTYLLLAVTYDAPASARDDLAYVEHLRQGLRERADQIWGLCNDYPGWADRDRFGAFLAERTLPAGYVFTSSDRQPSVGDIRQALDLRRRVVDVAVATQDLPPAELARRLRQALEPVPAVRPGRTHQGAALPQVPPAESAQLAAQHTVQQTARPSLRDPRPDAAVLARGDEIPTEPDLHDVQNLVTSGYPRHHDGLHLLLRVIEPVAARRWLDRVAEVVPTAGWADGYVDRLDFESPERDGDPGSDPRGRGPRTAVHVAISYAGLERLGLPDHELRGFAGEFRAGMAVREPGLAPDRGTTTWQPPFQPDQTGQNRTVDVLLMFSAVDAATLRADLADRPWLRPGPGQGFAVLDQITAGRIREDRYGPGDGVAKPGFLEHFGFVDGISQPRIHGVTPGRRMAELPAGEALLGYRDVDGDVSGAGLPPDLARNGSYLVYRKLEQDVPAFRELTRELAVRLRARADPGTDPVEMAAAKLMGRWRDGTPIVLSPGRNDPSLSRNHFGYQSDTDGLSCPVGAHIRRANPRDSGAVDPDSGGHDAELEKSLTRRHRMLRRGIPYGRPLSADGDDDGSDRGLLFVALVGDLRRQFEFVQAHWMSDGNAFRLGADRDPLAGAGEQGNKFVVQGSPPAFVEPSRPLVTCRGGEYFFLPGISALKRIAATPSGGEATARGE